MTVIDEGGSEGGLRLKKQEREKKERKRWRGKGKDGDDDVKKKNFGRSGWVEGDGKKRKKQGGHCNNRNCGTRRKLQEFLL